MELTLVFWNNNMAVSGPVLRNLMRRDKRGKNTHKIGKLTLLEYNLSAPIASVPPCSKASSVWSSFKHPQYNGQWITQ